MTMVLADPATRDFVIDAFLEDWQRGGPSGFDSREILAELRLLGDVARLERLSRELQRTP